MDGLSQCSDVTLQNILKRTAQGSQDEDMATKAFNVLKEVSSKKKKKRGKLSRAGLWASRGLPGPLAHSKRTPSHRVSGPQAGEHLGSKTGLWEPRFEDCR
jgi:hypothetical protein